jgi:hypothetical protein
VTGVNADEDMAAANTGVWRSLAEVLVSVVNELVIDNA